MQRSSRWLQSELERRGVSRRELLSYLSFVATTLALPKTAGAEMVKALLSKKKPALVWLEFQDCAGNTESFLRAGRPTVAEIILDTVSIDYHETLMAAAGQQAEDALYATVEQEGGAFIAVVEGAIPTGAGGAYCTIGGRSAQDIAEWVCRRAAATLAIGTCAAFGGLPAAATRVSAAPSPSSGMP